LDDATLGRCNGPLMALRAEADVTVDPGITVGTAHDLAHHAEEHLLAFVPRLTAATIHVSPVGAHTGPRPS